MKYSDSFINALKSGVDALRSAAHNVTNELEKDGSDYDDSIREILISQVEERRQEADILEGFIKRNAP